MRLKALAQLWSRGLPGGLGWADVLHEAIVRVLDGSRVWPFGVPILAFLSGVMRSICDDYWRCVRREQRLLVSRDGQGQGSSSADPIDELADPERVAVAVAGLAEVMRLFAGDPVVLKIIDGLANGLVARDICRAYGISALDYDTARRRMRRTLLRHQPNWSAP
ncbi:sigma-70 family RNA polymerase sigma factor [Bradyrhizobium ontarionense]|uniref:Sigma-70 family RNA polymerase sigma factor n=1 Tax=Bradyrhizobium ontarionense TaxID=2898149 RepID=A0ABY3RDS4_9BRAD|nr:sigma-70 family RNA polymerase sigma factor [Bradyrhizobium sp. A19]UFZ05575.1 sigma-70 family RNA polymerase sigma factor [Bradyrhizobium sp. A19]